MAEAAATGRRVLAALDAGRERAIAYQRERAARYERLVRPELDLDILAGHPERGRAGRIARRLGISEGGCRKILHRLSSCSASVGHSAAVNSAEARSA